jgi:hypothetical protein
MRKDRPDIAAWYTATMPVRRALTNPSRCSGSAGARKARAHRVRQAQRLSVLRLVVPQYDVISYLIETSRLTPSAALNRLAVERAAADALVELSRRWLSEKP